MSDSAGARDALTQVIERYDRTAAAYRELWAPILRSAALPLVAELQGGPVERVLDVAAGVGLLLPDLAAAFPGAFVLGVDRSPGMLAHAPKRYARALMDARDLALRARSVDRVSLLFMLFHLEDPDRALREAHRVLRPGGRVATLTWAGELVSTASRRWNECLDEHGAIAPDPAADARHEAVDSPAKVEQLLRQAGFEAPRSWVGELVCTIEASRLIRLKTSLGSSKIRFDSLAPAAAAACVEEARLALRALPAEDFIARGNVVCAIGSR